MDTIFGLPAHPLLVHISVVILPLAAIGAIVVAVSERWRARIGWIVVGLGVVGIIGTFMAKESGEALEEAVEGSANRALLEAHTSAGDVILLYVVPMVLLLIAVVAYGAWRTKKAAAVPGGTTDSGAGTRRTIGVILSTLLIISSLVASYQIIQVGHSGAKSVWSDTAVEGSGEGGEGGESGVTGGETGETGETGTTVMSPGYATPSPMGSPSEAGETGESSETSEG